MVRDQQLMVCCSLLSRKIETIPHSNDSIHEHSQFALEYSSVSVNRQGLS